MVQGRSFIHVALIISISMAAIVVSQTLRTSHTVRISHTGHNLVLRPKQRISLYALMLPRHRPVLNKIFSAIANFATNTQQFIITAETRHGRAKWTLEAKSTEPYIEHHTKKCPFCAIIANHRKGHIVAENNSALGFLDIKPYSYPHCLIIPKKLIVNMGTVTLNDYTTLGSMADLVAQLINEHPEYRKFRLVMHVGPAGEQTVYHLHWHFSVPELDIPAQEAFSLLAATPNNYMWA